MQKTKTPFLPEQAGTYVKKNIRAKKQPDALKRVRIQYLLVLVTFILLVGLGIFYVININQIATDTAISSYQQTEQEIVREAARGVQEYVYLQTEVLGRKDISVVEQEVYTKFIDPIRLLKNGDAWIYAPDHIVFDKSADLPPEYWGKSMAQIFALQQKNGASHYEEMTADVTYGREGVGYYIWLPEKGPEIAAWTPVRVGNHTWTIGLSTPLSEILESSGASSQITMVTAVILFSMILALILLSLLFYTDLKRKKVDEELYESEERFRLLFQNANDGIFVHEISPEGPGKFLDVNDQICRWLGYTHDEMAHMSVGEIDVPEQVKKIPEIIGQLVKDGYAVFETDFLTKDKERIPVEVSARLFDLQGKQTVLAIIRDITERKAADEALRTAETRFRALIQNSSDIIRILGRDGRILYESDSAERILGYQPGELIGTDPKDYIHEDDLERVKRDFQEVSDRTNPGTPTEYRIRKANGKYLWVDAIGTNLMDVFGVDGIVVTIRPIQQRKEAEQALSEKQVRLAAAMDIARLVNWEFDVASGMFTFDDRFYAVYETTAEREGGNQMSAETYMREFVYPEDRPAVLAFIQKILATTDPDYTGQIEHRITPRDGSVRTIIARFVPVMGPDGKVIRTHGANQDITDRMLMESEIRSLNTVLEQRVKERTEALVETNEKLKEENAQRLSAETKLQSAYNEKVMLLKEIHHRVKNNLQIIASLLNLQSRYITDEPTLAAIKESQNRVKAMALVHEKLYRSEDISHISLNDYIKFLGTGLFQFYDAKGRGIQFMLEIHDVNVDIDTAVPLGLIINELISNSLKYAFPDDRRGEVFVSVKKEGHTLTILFRDTGIGIPADLDWKNAPSLGLRLVTSLVDQLDGTIELDRTAGTAFTIVVKEKD